MIHYLPSRKRQDIKYCPLHYETCLQDIRWSSFLSPVKSGYINAFVFVYLMRGLPLLPRWHSGEGTALQIGRSLVRFQMVSLEFFIDIILLIALWPWGRLSL
jgi:hypothetical protein